jgi:hypothetical protein
MSMTTTMFRRLAERVAAVADHRTPTVHPGGARRRVFAPDPLLWRTPWLAWQILSWVTVTLLAPTFWVTGILLMINSHSDQPFFWPSMMAIVAITNVVAILHTNQHHFRRPFTGHMRLALHYFGVCVLTGSVLFLLLAWSTGILHDLVAPLASTVDAPAPLVWTAVVTAAFGLVSFAHASVLHAWFAFEA